MARVVPDFGLAERLTVMAVAVVLSGCSSILGLQDPDVSLGLRSESGYEWIGSYQVDIDGRAFRFEPATELRRQVEAPKSGELQVRVTLRDTAAETLAVADFTQSFDDDRNHWVSGLIGLQRPFGHCIGELTVLPLPRRAGEEQADTLFLMHGSIPKDAVC